MRKMMMIMMLASTVAMPAMAQDNGVSRRDRASNEQRREGRAERPQRAERQAQRAEREAQRAQQPQRAEQPQRVEQPQRIEQSQQGRGVERVQRGDRAQGGQRQSYRGRRDAPLVVQQQQQQAYQQQRSYQQQRYRDGYRGSRNGSINQQIRNSWGSQPGVTVVPRQRDNDRDRYDNRDRNRDRYTGSNRNWSGQWRNDRNYDWRNYRDRNRSIFRQSRYWDPYGSNYRRFSIGINLFPSYYQSNYWLDDPSMYRLPPAYGPYRWVRYYDDALLVNVYSGEVVDVVYSFFW